MFLINLSGFHLNWCVSTSFLFSHDSKFLGLESGNFHFFDICPFPIPQAHRSFTFVAIRNTLLNCFDFIAPRQAWQPGWAQWAWPCSLVFWQVVWDCNDSRSRLADIGYGKFRVFLVFPWKRRLPMTLPVPVKQASHSAHFQLCWRCWYSLICSFRDFIGALAAFFFFMTLLATRFGMGFGWATPRAGDAGPELGGSQLL